MVEGGANTSVGDIPDHQDIVQIEDRWKEYRNIVRGGFFFNDSVIVMADYNDDDRDSEYEKPKKVREAELLEKTELTIPTKEGKVPNKYIRDGKDSRDILKAGLKS